MLEWAALILLSICAGKALSYTSTLEEAAKLMAEKHGLGIRPIQYQNTLSPPWLANVTIFVWVAMLAVVAWIWYVNGWQHGLGASLGAFVLPAIFQIALPPFRGSGVFLRNAFHTMINRQANYERDGDQARAQAMAMNVSLLLEARPDLLDAFKQS